MIIKKSALRELLRAHNKRMSGNLAAHIAADVERRITKMCLSTGAKTLNVTDAVVNGGFRGGKESDK